MNRVVSNPDFASRLGRQLDELRTRFGHRHLLDAFREVNASLEPREVALWLAGQAATWVPAACWAVLAQDGDGRRVMLATHGDDLPAGSAVWTAAAWVMDRGQALFAHDLTADPRFAGEVAGSLLALPLTARGRTLGAMVAFDPLPSVEVPGLLSSLGWMGELLGPPAIALDNAIIVGRAEALSVTDELTRLFNLRFLNAVLHKETKRALRGARPLSLLFIDLDNFKAVNDRFGHMAGSEVLVETAAVIRGCARETDLVARFGGDEFAVVLPETGAEGALAVGRRIHARIRACPFLAARGPAVALTASIGVATLPEAAGSAEELLRAADMAMYRVKGAGKDGIHVAEEH